MKRTTIRDVANAAGVGIVTVSRALNDQEGVSEETRQRIKAVAQQLDYQPNRHARYLKLTNNRSVAIMVKGMDNPLFGGMLEVIGREVREKQYSMKVVALQHWADELQEAMRTIDEDYVAGVIFLGARFRQRESRLPRLKVPYVVSTVSNYANDDATYCSVSVSDRDEARQVVERLLARGHRRIGILGSDMTDFSVGRLRLEGYLEAMHEAGIRVPREWIRSFAPDDDSPYSYAHGYRMTQDLLRVAPDVTAIFGIADVLAIGAMRAAREAGLQVPSDISIAGFDGIEVSRHVQPALATLAQPTEQIAKLTCQMLFSQIDGEKPRQILVPGHWVEGGTIAQPRGE